MRIAFFDSHHFEREAFDAANERFKFEISFFEARLRPDTAVMARNHDAVCAFVNDELGAETLSRLKKEGVRAVLLRSAGYNHVNLEAAEREGLPVMRVPEYSPWAVAEHAVALLLMMDRKLHRAHSRVREGNFSLEGLVGFDLHGKTVGLVGTGKIGAVAAHIFLGFGCRVIAFDLEPSKKLSELDVEYVSLDELYARSDVISLHVPLTPKTKHLVDAKAFARMKEGVYLVNTSRGGLIDTPALIEALKQERIGGAALDVYEEEEGVFFRDLSDKVIKDDVLARLLTFPNVVITAHQGFLTREALHNIAETTLGNLRAFEKDGSTPNSVTPALVAKT
jgi:D-lactate dehydrogenase